MGLFDDLLQRRKREEEGLSQKRLPPGQSLTEKFPVLTYGPNPRFDPATWDLRVFGEVEREMRWSWAEFTALPTVTLTCDIHCVTRWSKFDTTWEGVPFKAFIALFGMKPTTKYVIAHCDYGYTTNLPVEAMLEDDVLLAYKYDGQLLEPDHGAPLRTLVPKRYFWKSAKFLRALEFSTTDKPGFWEQAGYHNDGDPWTEERYGRRGFF
ncbi:MAG: sulfite oxidase-like oxidoreductase [Anaerolineae bacterium]|jgi:DMSO/TMAO reductase YedYZ molybdopterin-dependent catalytic subunit|nr:sulfite oxidase-like oxidoreductase [Anaerolineae bacterium]